MKKQVANKSGVKKYLWILWPALVVFAGYYMLQNQPEAASSDFTPALPPGSAESGSAPAFSLADVNGRSVALADFKGKIVILDFWATWCPPCKREIPDFIELQKEYGPKGVQIVGIALDEIDKVKTFARQNGMNYPVLLGNDDIAMKYGGVSGIPTTFIIDQKGNIVNKFVGFRSKSEFESEIRKLM